MSETKSPWSSTGPECRKVYHVKLRATLSTRLATLLVCSSGAVTSWGQYQPRVGQPHPDFVLPRIDNRAPLSLSQFRGQKVLLIHFASW